MRIFKLSIIAVGISAFIVGCAGNSSNTPVASNPGNSTATNANNPIAQSPLTKDPDQALTSARTKYKEMCARCHQDNGEGGKVSSDVGSFTVPSFKRPSVIKEPDSEYVKYIRDGEEAMPSFKEQLTASQIDDLVRMIRSDFQNLKAPKQPN